MLIHAGQARRLGKWEALAEDVRAALTNETACDRQLFDEYYAKLAVQQCPYGLEQLCGTSEPARDAALDLFFTVPYTKQAGKHTLQVRG